MMQSHAGNELRWQGRLQWRPQMRHNERPRMHLLPPLQLLRPLNQLRGEQDLPRSAVQGWQGAGSSHIHPMLCCTMH